MKEHKELLYLIGGVILISIIIWIVAPKQFLESPYNKYQAKIDSIQQELTLIKSLMKSNLESIQSIKSNYEEQSSYLDSIFVYDTTSDLSAIQQYFKRFTGELPVVLKEAVISNKE